MQYTFQNVFSGQVIYESWTLSFYNVFYTVLPPLVLGILDQFISARLLDRYPQLYGMGQQNYFFKFKVFSQWIGNAIYHSIVLYIWGELFWYGDLILDDGTIAGHWVWGTALYGAVLLTVLGKAALVTSNWTKYHVIAIPGSMAFWYLFIAVYGIVAPMAGVSKEYHGVVPKLFANPVFWLQTVNLAVMCLLRDFVWKYAKRMYKPQTYHHIQEIQKYNIQDYRPRYVGSIPLAVTDANKAQNGTIPKSYSQGATSTAHAQAARIRLFAGRRESNACAPGIRHDKASWTIRRNGQLKAIREVDASPSAEWERQAGVNCVSKESNLLARMFWEGEGFVF